MIHSAALNRHNERRDPASRILMPDPDVVGTALPMHGGGLRHTRPASLILQQDSRLP
jgi:hypothetical protein